MDVKQIANGDGKDFYPTPPSLIDKMLTGIEWGNINAVLEPSAGKGDLAKEIRKRIKERHHYCYDKICDVDCIEIDTNLQHIVKGEGLRLVHDDFLSYHSLKKYDLIAMNPPFFFGDRHLLKAIDMQKHGGMIVALLNAETLKKPSTNTRMLLKDLLDKYRAQVQFLSDEFVHAERKTSVEVALIKIDIPFINEESDIYKNMKKAQDIHSQVKESTELTLSDYLEDLIAQYNVEVSSSVKLIHEYEHLKSKMLNGEYELTLTVGREANYLQECHVNKYLVDVRHKYWRHLFNNTKFTDALTSKLQEKYRNIVDKMSDYEFNMFNINNVAIEMNSELMAGLEDTIIELFEKLTVDHTWYPECAKNIHYFNGWKSNKAHKINKKVIIPTYGIFSTYEWVKDTFNVNNAFDVLSDIEKALNYLDGNMTKEVGLLPTLQAACDSGQTRKIICKYFEVSLFKKGTTHIKFTNERLIDKLNIYAARDKKWLPPDYGQKVYSDMSTEEKAIIDEFQGEENYKRVMNNQQYYLTLNTANTLRLNG